MKKILLILILLVLVSGCATLPHKKFCEESGGRWLSKYKECVGISPNQCEMLSGTFNGCASPCRHDKNTDTCITGCSSVCYINEIKPIPQIEYLGEVLSVPSEINVDVGGKEVFQIYLGNDGTVSGNEKFSLIITESEEIVNPDITVGIISKSPLSISEGQSETYKVVVVIDEKASLTPAGFIVTAKYGDEIYQESNFVVFPQK